MLPGALPAREESRAGSVGFNPKRTGTSTAHATAVATDPRRINSQRRTALQRRLVESRKARAALQLHIRGTAVRCHRDLEQDDALLAKLPRFSRIFRRRIAQVIRLCHRALSAALPCSARLWERRRPPGQRRAAAAAPPRVGAATAAVVGAGSSHGWQRILSISSIAGGGGFTDRDGLRGRRRLHPLRPSG